MLVYQNKCYHHYLHGIQEKYVDNLASDSDKLINLDKCLSLKENEKVKKNLKRSTRISLTIRHVPKTTKAFFRLGNEL